MSLCSVNERGSLLQRYLDVRRFSERLVQPLSAEDCAIQSMPDVSPTKWHLAHTTWFFETFVLAQSPDYRAFDESYAYLFNSYYNTIGQQYPRPRRGLISRPSLAEVMEYRRHVDESLRHWLTSDLDAAERLSPVVEIGLQHEQQHQELMLTDIKHVLFQNPCWPAYDVGSMDPAEAKSVHWIDHEEGIYRIGFDGDGFCYDNELARHRVFLESFQLCDTLVSCGQYLEFMEDGGYERPDVWLSLGWQAVQENDWNSPLYWQRDGDVWMEFTLAGRREVDPNRPVTHVSYFEADAFARWSGVRLPTEAEWEVAAGDPASPGNFVDTLLQADKVIHPGAVDPGAVEPGAVEPGAVEPGAVEPGAVEPGAVEPGAVEPGAVEPGAVEPGAVENEKSILGDVWQWTASPYVAYPGYKPPAGALGEYNGKFMCNQFVLRGGSVATSSSHIRPTYRNFFPADTRWQFSGIRLCR